VRPPEHRQRPPCIVPVTVAGQGIGIIPLEDTSPGHGLGSARFARTSSLMSVATMDDAGLTCTARPISAFRRPLPNLPTRQGPRDELSQDLAAPPGGGFSMILSLLRARGRVVSTRRSSMLMGTAEAAQLAH